MPRDRFRYFRIEAQELIEGLGQGLLALEQRHDAELVRTLLRQAHTFKGAARVVGRADIGDLAHQLEDQLTSLAGAPAARPVIDAALALLDDIRQRVATLGAPPAPDAAPAAPAQPATTRTPSTTAPLRNVRVDIAELDALLDGLHEAQRLATRLGAKPQALESLERSFEALTARVGALRLVPAAALIGELERAVRDAAHTCGRAVVLHAVGAETRLDADVLGALGGALGHVVRNAVVHGVEDAAERRRQGKPAIATVELSIERHGHRVTFVCRDDGRGLDLAAIARTARERGLLAQDDEAPDREQLVRLLLHGGISTSAQVSELAGRGVGLDVVRSTAERLGGEVELRSEPGRGTTLRVTVPISLSTIPALAMQLPSGRARVPLDAVVRAVTLRADDLSWSPQGERLVLDGQTLSFARLERLLGSASSSPETSAEAPGAAVLVQASGRQVALGVARVLGVQTALVRSLPAHAGDDPRLLGAVLAPDGALDLMLSPAALVEALSTLAPAPRAAAPAAPRPLLVIDDSLTTRMLEQSILESAGYEVELAVSGEEAMGKARQRRYGLFVVDVEMPGMSGFDFVEQTRADPELSKTPAILVTSRNDAADKQRGRDVGASAYIVKSEFDQQRLLAIIHDLLARSARA